MNTFNHADEFKRLHSLVGAWSGVTEAGDPMDVNYRLSANDSTLVEDWTFHNGIDALTLFHMDEAQLMATHFCPIGNQPRFVLREKKPSGALMFDFLDATNLADLKDPHGHAFEMRTIDANTFERHETYVEDNGEMETNGTVFRRV